MEELVSSRLKSYVPGGEGAKPLFFLRGRKLLGLLAGLPPAQELNDLLFELDETVGLTDGHGEQFGYASGFLIQSLLLSQLVVVQQEGVVGCGESDVAGQ